MHPLQRLDGRVGRASAPVGFFGGGRSPRIFIPRITWSPGQLRRHEGLAVRYLAVGRGQEFRGEFWPFVIGVVTEPQNEEPIDYGRT